MNLAVKFYSDADNPEGLPGAWPAEVIELGEGTDLPEGPWTLMTVAEYEAYREQHQAEYDAWVEANTVPPSIPGDDI